MRVPSLRTLSALALIPLFAGCAALAELRENDAPPPGSSDWADSAKRISEAAGSTDVVSATLYDHGRLEIGFLVNGEFQAWRLGEHDPELDPYASLSGHAYSPVPFDSIDWQGLGESLATNCPGVPDPASLRAGRYLDVHWWPLEHEYHEFVCDTEDPGATIISVDGEEIPPVPATFDERSLTAALDIMMPLLGDSEVASFSYNGICDDAGSGCQGSAETFLMTGVSVTLPDGAGAYVNIGYNHIDDDRASLRMYWSASSTAEYVHDMPMFRPDAVPVSAYMAALDDALSQVSFSARDISWMDFTALDDSTMQYDLYARRLGPPIVPLGEASGTFARR